MAKLTNKQKIDIKEDMLIIIDSREQKYKHITKYLDSIGVPWKVEKLDVGDYSFELPNYPHLELDRKYIVELKGSLDEVAGNFTKDRARFQRMFERLEDNQVIHLVLENFTWQRLLNGSYRSKFNPKAFKASLIAWSIKYDFKYHLVTKRDSGEIIYEILEKELRHYLDNLK